jgi:hypothetical protein
MSGAAMILGACPQKGGVGKTTIAVNFAAALARDVQLINEAAVYGNIAGTAIGRPNPLRTHRDGSGLTGAQWAYFIDRPWSKEQLATAGERWTNYRLMTDSATFGSLHDGGAGYARRLWFAYEADILAAWGEDFPGMRPSQWWRFAAPEEAREGEATHEYLDRHGLWLDGERDRAEALVGRLKQGREVVKAPHHPQFDQRGRYRPPRDVSLSNLHRQLDRSFDCRHDRRAWLTVC